MQVSHEEISDHILLEFQSALFCEYTIRMSTSVYQRGFSL
jgi:hypothetical protein